MSFEVPTQWLELCAKINYQFKDKYLLREALTHPSWQGDVDFSGHNQRLEFLGDSVLGLYAVNRLFVEYGGLAEGAMTSLKNVMVSELVLAEVARGLGLGECLRMEKNLRINALKENSYLADALEALWGAVFKDGGWHAAEQFGDLVFWNQAKKIMSQQDMTDYKSTLARHAQSLGLPLPQYVEFERLGTDHAPIFVLDVIWAGEVYARGQGPSKKVAGNAAAKAAWIKLQC